MESSDYTFRVKDVKWAWSRDHSDHWLCHHIHDMREGGGGGDLRTWEITETEIAV